MIRSLFAGAALSAALLFPAVASAQTIGCQLGGTGGPIPTSGTGGGGVFPTTFPPSPTTCTINVASTPPGATCVTEVRLNGLTHTYAGDLQFVLQDPAGAKYNIFCRAGGGCDFNGNYAIVPAGTGCGAFPTTCAGTNFLANGSYDPFFGTWTSGTQGVNNTDLSAIPPQTGIWTLTIYDWAGADIGALTSFDVCFGTPGVPLPPCSAPALTSPANGASLFGPNVTLNWSAYSGATSYDVDVDGVITNVATNSFVYASTPGLHTWTARAKNAAGAGPWATAFTFTDLGAPPGSCTGPSLTTLYATNNGGSVGGIVYFDINVTNPSGITLSQLDTNTGVAVGNAFGMDVYMIPGTSVGFESNSAAWTLMASGGAVAAGLNQPSVVEFPDFPVATGSWGVALVMLGADHRYTNGTGANQVYSNSDLSITCGKAANTPWATSQFSPRVWNGALRYNCGGGPPVSYCTPGTSTNGCTASITADNNPSVSQANPCNISVSSVEGQKSGLIFYGLGQVATPWATGSTSFLCVKAPTQRTTTQSSGGTVSQCNGSLALDFHAFLAANPGSLGQPFSAGNKVYAQAWYRDPPAPKTTNLSDGVELTFQP